MLGEIRLINEDIAQIKIRIPFSFASLIFATFIGLVNFFLFESKTASVVPSFLEADAVIILIGFFSLFEFLPEKDKMIRRLNDIKNYLEDTVETLIDSKKKIVFQLSDRWKKLYSSAHAGVLVMRDEVNSPQYKFLPV